MTSKTQLSFVVVDADAHVYEPEDIWDRYVPTGEQGLARDAFWHAVDGRGNETTVLNGVGQPNINRSLMVREAIWRPGMTVDDIGALDPYVPHDLNPGAFDPTARLADMDAMGVDQAVLYPTLFGEYLPLVRNPVAAAVLCRAYNDWLYDFCQHAPDRLHPAAILPLQSMLLAQRELDRVVERGFRTVALRPMSYEVTGEHETPESIQSKTTALIGAFGPPIGWRGPYLLAPHFRPLWDQLAQLDVAVGLHPSHGIASPELASSGAFTERVAANLGIGHPIADSVAYRQDMANLVAAICFGGLFEDYPKLRVALAHAGATSLPLMIEKAEVYLWCTFSAAIQPLQPVSLEPFEIFGRHPLGVTFSSWEDAVLELSDDLYAGKCTWGSRYPHHDACEPAEAIEGLERNGADASVIAAMMGGNAIELFGLPTGDRVATTA